VLEHLPAVDFEAFAELDCCVGDQLLEERLAFDQRQFPQIVAIEMEQIESDQHDLV
jgi:hypothetical protein